MYGSSWRDRLAGVKVSPTPTSSELLNTDDNAAEKSLNILQTKPAPTVNSTTPIAQIPQRKTEKKEELIAEATVEERFEQCKEKGNSFVKQFILAEEDASKALDLQEDNLKALYRRGLARKALRKYEEAAKDLVNLIKIEPSNASGRKELEIVLNLCREARKAKKKVTNESQPTVSEIKTSEKQNDSKVEPNKATRRRRVQIEEVNSEEDSDQASSTTSSPSVSKKTPDTSSKATKNESIQEVSDKTDKEEAKAKTSPVKEHKRKKIKLHKVDLVYFVLSNKLDADMFRSIVGTVSEQLLPNGEEKLSFEILQHMCKAQRFDMVMMFLDASDNKGYIDVELAAV
ncbi:hypothetical protein QZH41_005118 [Actinostola sp. cb2023]|nr:hypothetical protein QZH41_005118 [Actinostola sp. cb2023]